MKIRAQRNRRSGFLEVDLAVALVVLSMAIVPLGFAFMQERAALRAEYCRAVADEIVDGETEILAAGDWKNLPDGTRPYTVHSRAAANLPPGHFELRKGGNHLRLEWLPDGHPGGAIVREIMLK